MKQPVTYFPIYRLQPKTEIAVPSAWKGIPPILSSLLHDFKVERRMALEFGVEYGYSLSALSEHFGVVVGIDTFTGLGHGGEFFAEVQRLTSHLENVVLIRKPFQEFILEQGEQVDLIHVDIDHNYEDTYRLGEWSVRHSPVVIFHDTLSYPEVMRACGDIAERHNLTFYNFEESHGLGILSRRKL